MREPIKGKALIGTRIRLDRLADGEHPCCNNVATIDSCNGMFATGLTCAACLSHDPRRPVALPDYVRAAPRRLPAMWWISSRKTATRGRLSEPAITFILETRALRRARAHQTANPITLSCAAWRRPRGANLTAPTGYENET